MAGIHGPWWTSRLAEGNAPKTMVAVNQHQLLTAAQTYGTSRAVKTLRIVQPDIEGST